jgi:NAD(P)-dependent dehydrogenase (short-subunit alcohol dehydrogenase family)
MSSGTANYGRIHFGDLQYTRHYRPSLAYAQSKLADMLMARQLAALAVEQEWSLLSTVAHPGYTRTNLQTSGANLGRSKPVRRMPGDRTLLPSQGVEQGTEPLLFAATSPDAVQGGYYGPGGALGLVGPTKRVALPRSARGLDLASSLWSVAADLTDSRIL